MDIHIDETFAGPSEELDKMEAINWSLISSDYLGDITDGFQFERLDENSGVLSAVIHESLALMQENPQGSA